MSGRKGSIPPRSRPAPDRPPVDSCTIMPGQCRSSPSFSRAKRSGSEVGRPSSSRTWQWAMLAPASNASCALSICSGIVTGTAGLSALVGTEPVIATQMMQGLVMVGASHVEEYGFGIALKADVEMIVAALGTSDQSLPPVRLFYERQHRVGGIGGFLIPEIHPGAEANIDAARHQPEVEMRGHEAAIAAHDGAGFDGVKAELC